MQLRYFFFVYETFMTFQNLFSISIHYSLSEKNQKYRNVVRLSRIPFQELNANKVSENQSATITTYYIAVLVVQRVLVYSLVYLVNLKLPYILLSIFADLQFRSSIRLCVSFSLTFVIDGEPMYSITWSGSAFKCGHYLMLTQYSVEQKTYKKLYSNEIITGLDWV